MEQSSNGLATHPSPQRWGVWGLHTPLGEVCRCTLLSLGSGLATSGPWDKCLSWAYLAQVEPRNTGIKTMQTLSGGKKQVTSADSRVPSYNWATGCLGSPCHLPKKCLLWERLQDWCPVPPTQMLFLRGQDIWPYQV